MGYSDAPIEAKLHYYLSYTYGCFHEIWIHETLEKSYNSIIKFMNLKEVHKNKINLDLHHLKRTLYILFINLPTFFFSSENRLYEVKSLFVNSINGCLHVYSQLLFRIPIYMWKNACKVFKTLPVTNTIVIFLNT